MSIVRYLTHPQVQIDPDVPVPQWGLSPTGRARTEALAQASWLAHTTQIVSSGERKAIETAEIIAIRLGIMIEIREAMLAGKPGGIYRGLFERQVVELGHVAAAE